jgi:phospholipid/cholesterol/gamma-HCH transport system substrate-binding protein
MEQETKKNIRLGIFVLGGIIFLVLLLYMIGKNQNLFGNTYVLKTRFKNVQGLVPGNNVRFAGIASGTVKKINILNDTLIEVTMYLDNGMKKVIRKNAVTSIGTDGLVGNKLVNIVPSGEPSPLAKEGDILSSKYIITTEEMLTTLNKTNNDIAEIAASLKVTVAKINSSNALWSLLNDETISNDLRASIGKVRNSTENAALMMNDLHAVIADIKDGKGSLGELIRDSSFSRNLNEAVVKITKVGNEADSLAKEIHLLTSGIKKDINTGKGPANYLLKDSSMAIKINASLDNIQKGTEGFNQNMEALKHNFLFRGYFRKLEKKKEKEKSGKD